MRPLAKKDDLVIQEVDGEVLVYDLSANKAVCLNQTSALVWQNCDGKKNAIEIAGEISKKLNTNVSEEMIWFAVNQLNKENLLKPKADYTDKFSGLSRREVIKKIGLGTMIAIPVVSSLMAPEAAFAQSTCNTGAACTCTIDGMTAGQGQPCAAVGVGGCSNMSTCMCIASTSGNNNFTGTCSL